MPVQVLGIYTALVVLVYLATDAFQNNAPFIFTLPVVVLGLITIKTKMTRRKKFLTALSFFTLAAALYHLSVYPNELQLSGIMICVSHIIYLFSFYRSLRKIWYSLAILTTIVMSIFLYTIFADLYRSVPTLVFTLCLSSAILSLSFTVAGSVWKNGSTMIYEEKTPFIRFVGMFFLLICNSALLINHFERNTKTVVWYLNFTYYISQYLLYFANERAF